MNRRVRMGIIIAVLGIGLVLVGFYVLSTFLRQTLTPAPAPTPIPPLTEKVVVTTRDIALGSLIKAEDVAVSEVPVEFVPRNTLSDVGSVVGRITKVNLVAGEMVLDHNLADPTNVNRDLAFVIGDEAVLMAFQPNDLMVGLNIFQRGDVVDIFVSSNQTIPATPNPMTGEQGTITKLFTYDAMQKVQLSAVVVEVRTENQAPAVSAEATPAPTPVPPPSAVSVKALLLALAPQDALLLKHLKDSGATFDLVLRSPTSAEFFTLTPVTDEYIIDRYGLRPTER